MNTIVNKNKLPFWGEFVAQNQASLKHLIDSIAKGLGILTSFKKPEHTRYIERVDGRIY